MQPTHGTQDALISSHHNLDHKLWRHTEALLWNHLLSPSPQGLCASFTLPIPDIMTVVDCYLAPLAMWLSIKMSYGLAGMPSFTHISQHETQKCQISSPIMNTHRQFETGQSRWSHRASPQQLQLQRAALFSACRSSTCSCNMVYNKAHRALLWHQGRRMPLSVLDAAATVGSMEGGWDAFHWCSEAQWVVNHPKSRMGQREVCERKNLLYKELI